MPTAYTAPVGDGKITEFSAFAMLCARAFGALIEMRDDDLNKPIPKEFEPSNYHADQATVAAARLNSLYAMTNHEADEAAAQSHADDMVAFTRRVKEKNDTRLRYAIMLKKVEDFTPPTPEHEGLKKFMRQQLSESIDFDCVVTKYDVPPTALTGSEWREKEIAKARRGIEYHSEEHTKEIERVRGRNKWLRDLRVSLGIVEESAQ